MHSRKRACIDPTIGASILSTSARLAKDKHNASTPDPADYSCTTENKHFPNDICRLVIQWLDYCSYLELYGTCRHWQSLCKMYPSSHIDIEQFALPLWIIPAFRNATAMPPFTKWFLVHVVAMARYGYRTPSR